MPDIDTIFRRPSFMRRISLRVSGWSVVVSSLALLMFSSIGGCGYTVGGPYRQDIRTIHVPIFQSSGFRRDVEFQLTEAVHKEIQKQTHFLLVKGSEADTRLTGQIVQISKPLLGESAFDDARELQYTMAVQVTWKDLRTGREENQSLPIDADVVHLLSTSDFAPELGPSQATARQRAVESLARQIVRMMQYPW